MAKFVGVISPISFQNSEQLKRLLLLFEQLAIDLSNQNLTLVERRALSAGKRDFDYLRDQGLLTTVEGARADRRGNLPEASKDPPMAEFLGLTGIDRVLRTAAGTVGPAGRIKKIGLREVALRLRADHDLDAVAVGDERLIGIDSSADRSEVIRVTLKALPVPSDLTPWEEIEEFRRDPDSRLKHLRLKAWINKVGKQNTPLHELEDELMQLLFEYEEFIRFHNIKTTKGIVEVLVTTPAEIAEDVVKMKWGKIAKAPFEIAKQQAALYDAERAAPGREVAYIFKARRHFGGGLSPV